MGVKSTDLLKLFTAEHGRLVRLIGRIVGCRDTAEDLAHDAFLRLWGRAVTGDDRSLLFRTGQNLALDHLRARRVREDYAEAVVAEQVRADAPPPDAAAAAKQELDAVLEVLRSLPERTQRVFLLNRLDGVSYPDIARMLGVSVSTVEKDMIRALDLCRRRMPGGARR